MAIVNVGAYGDDWVDISSSDLSCEADSQKQCGCECDIWCNMLTGGADSVSEDEAGDTLEEDDVELAIAD